MLPFRRNANFIDRKELWDLEQKLAYPGSRVALVGPAGVGKTQLAAEYCYWLRGREPDTRILWLYANGSARLAQSIWWLASQLNIHDRGFSSDHVFASFCAWLRDAKNEKWILVLDSADDDDANFATDLMSDQDDGATAAMQMDFLPTCAHGSMVVTSRRKELALQLVHSKDIIDLDHLNNISDTIQPLSEDHAMAMLERRFVRQMGRSSTKEVIKLLDYLGCLPLTASQTAAYDSQGTLHHSQKERWPITYPRAKRILDMKPQGRRASLLWANIAFNTTRYMLGQPDLRPKCEVLIRSTLAINAHFLGQDEVETLVVQDLLARVLMLQGRYDAAEEPAREVADGSEKILGEEQPMTCQRLNILGALLWYQGKYDAAEEIIRRLLRARSSTLGRCHVDTLDSMQNLAATLIYKGKSCNAEMIARQVVAGRMKMLGRVHPSTQISIRLLTRCLQLQHKSHAAMALNWPATDISGSMSGSGDDDVFAGNAIPWSGKLD